VEQQQEVEQEEEEEEVEQTEASRQVTERHQYARLPSPDKWH
jgi:hypothetical protein